jgi:integrase
MAVKKTKTGYQVQYYDADGRFRKRTFRGITRDEAVRLEREILAARDRGERQPDSRKAPTFASFVETWIEEFRSGWKQSTLEDYKSTISSRINPAFGHRRISTITESELRRFITKLRDEGLSPRRINYIMALVKSIFRTAHRRKWLSEDPTANIRKLKEEKAEIDPLSSEEINRFLEACPSWWRPYFLTAFLTGARPNELQALKWGDVELSGKTFRIRAGRYRGVESSPKTSAGIRDVDLLPSVIEALKTQKAQQASNRLRKGRGAMPAGDDYVFTGE